MANPTSSEYMKIAEAARFLGVTQRWVYRRVLSGELPASKVGGLYFINRKDLQALLDAGRVMPLDTREGTQKEALPRLKCGFCYRLLKDDSEIGGTCEHLDCTEVICNKCWELNIHTCAQHSPNREQRLQKAEKKKEAGEIPVLVKAGEARLVEATFLNRIHAHLSGFSTVIHPASGETINVSSWEEILETKDDRVELMHLLGKVALDSATLSQIPLNACYHYVTKSKTRKSNPLELHIQVISRMENMVRDGFDSQLLSLDSLNLWIEKLVEAPTQTGNFRLVILASTTGWDESARAAIIGSEGYAYNHRLALLYLFDMQENELIYNASDDRTRRYAELFRPILSSEELLKLTESIKEKLIVYESFTLVEAQEMFSSSPEKVKQAFELIAKEGEFQLTDYTGLGIALVKK